MFSRKITTHGLIFLLGVFFLLTGSGCTEEQNGSDEKETKLASGASDWLPTYAAPDHQNYATTQASQTALQNEINNKDLTAIRKHGWEIWGAITALTDQTDQPGEEACGVSTKLAVFDTWWGQEEIFNPTIRPDGKSLVNNPTQTKIYHSPRQAGGAEVLSFNKYSKEFITWVNKNKLYEAATLINFNKELDKMNAPLAKREVNTFIGPPNPAATMLKPTFWVLKPDQPAMMPYWVGPLDPVSSDNSEIPKTPTVSTWKNFVLFDPTGKADPTKPREVTIYGLNGPEKHMVVPKKVVKREDFYAIPLTAENVDFIQGGNIFTIGGIPVTEIEPCDLAVLVGMHVTTAEVKNWTWQTFYFAPFPSDTNQPTVTGPFKNFDMSTAYFFDNASGNPHIAYNPYLEPPITGPTFMNPITMTGSQSNCMTCHHAAAFPTMNGTTKPGTFLLGSYLASGPVTGSEQFFKNRVKTTFMWGMILSLQLQSPPPKNDNEDEPADGQ